ncbi:response regulator transcription factor [Natronincola ferrireducens]|uniref:Stage 0 sporulation protein A homolog n=1 Tax=Natronincola ferrireducens TaxID=393762 RepID=A0A1G8Y7X4_9FIRM|nr:response regulator [Natronincola ferrireducens]SDJ98813.1 two component transcriptional regulator, AraC family [Natronincola ferrireducens]
MWKVAIVDDEPKIRRGFKGWIEEFGHPFQFAGEAPNTFKALEIIDRQFPHVFFLDIRMGGDNGLELAKFIKSKNSKTLIIMVTGYDYFEYAHEAIKLHVFDYLLKPVPKTDFFKILKDIDKYLCQQFPQDITKKSDYNNENHKNYSIIVLRVKEYIENNYYKPDISLQKVAQLHNVNKGYLSKLMKEELGYSFTELLTKIRIARAKELLKEDLTGAKIYEIAKKIGYQSQHYFSRVFKNSEGISPLEYRTKNFKD